jgi:hypothetical protein
MQMLGKYQRVRLAGMLEPPRRCGVRFGETVFPYARDGGVAKQRVPKCEFLPSREAALGMTDDHLFVLELAK